MSLNGHKVFSFNEKQMLSHQRALCGAVCQTSTQCWNSGEALTKRFVTYPFGDKCTATFLISLFSRKTQQVILPNPFPSMSVLATLSFPAHVVYPKFCPPRDAVTKMRRCLTAADHREGFLSHSMALREPKKILQDPDPKHVSSLSWFSVWAERYPAWDVPKAHLLLCYRAWLGSWPEPLESRMLA